MLPSMVHSKDANSELGIGHGEWGIGHWALELISIPVTLRHDRGDGSAVSLRQINCRDTALPSPDFGNINNSDATEFDRTNNQ